MMFCDFSRMFVLGACFFEPRFNCLYFDIVEVTWSCPGRFRVSGEKVVHEEFHRSLMAFPRSSGKTKIQHACSMVFFI